MFDIIRAAKDELSILWGLRLDLWAPHITISSGSNIYTTTTCHPFIIVQAFQFLAPTGTMSNEHLRSSQRRVLGNTLQPLNFSVLCEHWQSGSPAGLSCTLTSACWCPCCGVGAPPCWRRSWRPRPPPAWRRSLLRSHRPCCSRRKMTFANLAQQYRKSSSNECFFLVLCPFTASSYTVCWF